MDAILQQYGLAGVVIGALTTAVVILWKKNNELQDKRLEDLKQIQGKTDTTLSGLMDLSQRIYDRIPEYKRGK